jgi:hypothetical protein
MSASPPTSDIRLIVRHFRFGPQGDIEPCPTGEAEAIQFVVTPPDGVRMACANIGSLAVTMRSSATDSEQSSSAFCSYSDETLMAGVGSSRERYPGGQHGHRQYSDHLHSSIDYRRWRSVSSGSLVLGSEREKIPLI